MTYETCVQAVKEILEEMPEFQENVSIGDYSILNYGIDPGLILDYGGFNQEPRTSTGPTTRLWVININMFVRYLDDITVHENRTLWREKIINKIQVLPQLRIEVFNAEVVSGRELPPFIDNDNNWLPEEISCLIEEISPLLIE